MPSLFEELSADAAEELFNYVDSRHFKQGVPENSIPSAGTADDTGKGGQPLLQSHLATQPGQAQGQGKVQGQAQTQVQAQLQVQAQIQGQLEGHALGMDGGPNEMVGQGVEEPEVRGMTLVSQESIEDMDVQ
jgi:hypothetical protein